MSQKNFEKIFRGVVDEEKIFADKSYLNTLSKPKIIIGRENKIREILRNLIGYKKGFAVPLVSIYGRSGTGKTTITKYVCENLKDISFCYVNFRRAKTIFGAANLILEALGKPQTSSQLGLSTSIKSIENAIISKLEEQKKTVFVLILDEIDSILNDKRGNPSDFFYKLLVLEENLKEKEYLASLITISNHLFENYSLDDRVKSRIGSNHVFFEPYSKTEVFKILKKNANKAFSSQIDDDVLQLCSELSSQEHGDARRAIELLRISAETAAASDEKISKNHVKKAHYKIGSSTVEKFLSSSPFQMRSLCYTIASICFISGEQWHATSSIYNRYIELLTKENLPLSYRRISDLLNELEQAGIVMSSTRSHGRYGYGKKYQLTIPPETIGLMSPELFEKWKIMKEKYYNLKNNPDLKYNRDYRLKFDRFEGLKEYRKTFGQL